MKIIVQWIDAKYQLLLFTFFSSTFCRAEKLRAFMNNYNMKLFQHSQLMLFTTLGRALKDKNKRKCDEWDLSLNEGTAYPNIQNKLWIWKKVLKCPSYFIFEEQNFQYFISIPNYTRKSINTCSFWYGYHLQDKEPQTQIRFTLKWYPSTHPIYLHGISSVGWISTEYCGWDWEFCVFRIQTFKTELGPETHLPTHTLSMNRNGIWTIVESLQKTQISITKQISLIWWFFHMFQTILHCNPVKLMPKNISISYGITSVVKSGW